MKVSVLMPVYNGEPFLKDAIQSVLNQTISDFELIIVNDGSKDKSESIIKKFYDSRIIYINNEINIGLVKSLNKGISVAAGEYIARMDQDDICHPDRLARQVHYLDLNSKVGVCGTSVYVFGDKKFKLHVPQNSPDIAIQLLFNNSMVHPTVMIRKSVLSEFDIKYDYNYAHAEDYALWARLITVTQIYNLQDLLLKYRWHKTNYSNTKTSEQREIANKIRINYIKQQLLINVAEEEATIHKFLCEGKFNFNEDEICSIENWLLKLYHANIFHKKLHEKLLKKTLLQYWEKVLVNSCSVSKSINIYSSANEMSILGKDYISFYKNLLKRLLNRR